MYKDIGSKIKILVESTVFMLIAIFVLIGVGGLFTGAGIGGILIATFGSLIVWIGGFVLYGFGELIETTKEINEKLDSFVDIKLKEHELIESNKCEE